MGERNKHIENLRKGNRSSFEYLYTVWSGKLYNFVMKISHGDSYLAEEMALFSDKRFLMGILTNVVWKKVKSGA